MYGINSILLTVLVPRFFTVQVNNAVSPLLNVRCEGEDKKRGCMDDPLIPEIKLNWNILFGYNFISQIYDTQI